jgi:cystathionine beta-synthase
MEALFNGNASLTDQVDKHMSPALPMVGTGEAVDTAVKALGSTDALLVVSDGKPVGVVTRADLLGFLATPH